MKRPFPKFEAGARAKAAEMNSNLDYIETELDKKLTPTQVLTGKGLSSIIDNIDNTITLASTYTPALLFSVNSGNVNDGQADILYAPGSGTVTDASKMPVLTSNSTDGWVLTSSASYPSRVSSGALWYLFGNGSTGTCEIYVDNGTWLVTLAAPADRTFYLTGIAPMTGWSAGYYRNGTGCKVRIYLGGVATELGTYVYTNGLTIPSATRFDKLELYDFYGGYQADDLCHTMGRMPLLGYEVVSVSIAKTCYFKVGGTYPELISTTAEGETFTQQALKSITLDSSGYIKTPALFPSMNSASEGDYSVSSSDAVISADVSLYELIGQRVNTPNGYGCANGWSLVYGWTTPIKLTKLVFYNGKYPYNSGNTVQKIELLQSGAVVATFTPNSAENSTTIFDLSGINALTSVSDITFRFNDGISGDNKSYAYVKGLILECETSIDISSGTCNVFTSPISESSVFKNNIYKQRVAPATPGSRDIWLDTSIEPLTSKQYFNGTWHKTDLVPIGKITTLGGLIQTVITYPYNQNGYAVNQQTQGLKLPDFTRPTAITANTSYIAPVDGWLYVGSSAVATVAVSSPVALTLYNYGSMPIPKGTTYTASIASTFFACKGDN